MSARATRRTRLRQTPRLVYTRSRPGRSLPCRCPPMSHFPAAPAEATPPLPLGEAAEAPPFPLDVLPADLAELAARAAESVQCPPDFVAVPLLALAGACLG